MNCLQKLFSCLGKTSATIITVETGITQQTPTTIIGDIKEVITATVDTVNVVNELKKNPIGEISNLASK
ncbi:MAG: hypothetical protein P4L41_07850 [Flavipsychrobacter sp.]|nr:hypothetical protein [Flavipsychrobacter sp.]